MKISELPFRIYYQIESLSKACSKIDALIGLLLIVFALILIPRLYNTAEKTYLNIGLYRLGESFATEFNQLRSELDKEAESLGLGTLEIRLIDRKDREVYGVATGYTLSNNMTYAKIEIKSGPFEFGSNLHISISTKPKKIVIENKIEKLLESRYTESARFMTQDILRQFDNYERLNAPNIGIYGVSLEGKTLPIIMLCLALLCIHFIKEYEMRISQLKQYDELEGQLKTTIFNDVVSIPAIDGYKNKVYFPLRGIFLVSIATIYVCCAFLTAADPRWLSNDAGPAIIFKSGLFSSILMEGLVVIFSLFILARAYKNTLYNNTMQPTASAATTPSTSADG